MMHAQPLPWMSPLEAAAAVDEDYWVLLYSGAAPGQKSFLAHGLKQQLKAEDFEPLIAIQSKQSQPFHERWFGYFGYDLKHSLEELKPQPAHDFGLPNLWLMQFHHLYVFDHAAQKLVRYSSMPQAAPLSPRPLEPYSPAAIISLGSNMSRSDYLGHVQTILHAIHAGTLYQANLTRKFFGEWAQPVDALALFDRLRRISPAAYSAYLRLGDCHIISSSPELFLRASSDGRITSEPIKGSARRSAIPQEDEAARQRLRRSEKDRAENLMIVDLMRHDFSRCCEVGSVEVEALCALTTHPTIHHLSSIIHGKLRSDQTTLQAIAACFPPGSMTGAPKISAMNLCTMLEQDARGVYSGALGWLDADGSAELSVVIRTLIINKTKFEFQVGGGIVADSLPEAELEETITKARALCLALGIDSTALHSL